MASADVAMPDASSAMTRREHLAKTFESYRAELDANVIILSRAITQLSKKLIFHLHRGATSPPAAREKNLKDARTKEREIYKNFVAVRDELASGTEEDGETLENFWKFSRPVFLYYLECGELVSLPHLQQALTDEEGEKDYILGMSDLTGELMRYATNALSTGDHETPLQLTKVFDSIPESTLHKLKKKQEETTRSLEKIEKAVCYSLRLRLVEFGDKPEVLRHLAKRAMDAANMNGGGEQREGN
ncbi:hypothetical protein A1Q2_01794 [Trichosporon asahii var. asahii CBS 8904]|uniref:Translin n=2 Tax=Trichosporon asahii var. asahii TaxID=189963 RepID=K1VTA4_TRIAC|nr:hypothetical protein A1Q1_04437 [Trichosporon asahii var. asahii CBS 2479]EJT46836.1 hypothetical protein A1Q1_04437 [Trichosporon asahii var. asahii CBS 2479]EKD03781.1 hypothetical protein A1Q2_01794 [Trichosporon asahii var. asahii CBS 8904]